MEREEEKRREKEGMEERRKDNEKVRTEPNKERTNWRTTKIDMTLHDTTWRILIILLTDNS